MPFTNLHGSNRYDVVRRSTQARCSPGISEIGSIQIFVKNCVVRAGLKVGLC